MFKEKYPMKQLISNINLSRQKVLKQKNYVKYLETKYRITTFFEIIRGLSSCFLGRIKYDGDYRPLLLGSNIDFLLESGSAIVLTGNSSHPDVIVAANTIYPNATSIGTRTHYNRLDPPSHNITRVQLAENAQLVMDNNSLIMNGSYITVSANRKLQIGANTYISQGVKLNTRSGLTIGNNVLIGHDTLIMDYDGHPIFEEHEIDDGKFNIGGNSQPIVIEDNVWIGHRATILKGVTVGKGAVVGARSCVTSDVLPNTIVAGNPARVVKENIKWRRY